MSESGSSPVPNVPAGVSPDGGVRNLCSAGRRTRGFGHFVSAPKARKSLSPGQRPGIGWQNPCGLKGRDSLPETNAAILIHLVFSTKNISRRIPALSGTPSGRLRRALCLGLRICTGPSGRESLPDSSPRPLAWAERSRAFGAEIKCPNPLVFGGTPNTACEDACAPQKRATMVSRARRPHRTPCRLE